MPVHPLTRRRVARRMVAAVAVCAAVGGCGNSEKGGNPEAPSSPQPASEGHQVAASDVASIKDANAAIRACRSGGVATPQITQGVTALLVVYRSAGPEARYESNLNPVPINMRGVVQNAERALRRCGHATEAQRLAAALDEG